jgi:phosphoglucomutase
MSVIKFGTDGWRAKMGEDFSFNNVRIFAQGYANYLKNKRKEGLRVIVNFDTKYFSHKFALEVSKIFSLNGIQTYIPDRDLPIASIALAIVKQEFVGGVIVTASFNEPIYNGIKVLSQQGVPALPSETQLIEEEINKVAKNYSFKPQYPNNENIKSIDLKDSYIDYIEELIDFDLIRNTGTKIIVDNLYGTSREFLDHVLYNNDIEIETIHNFPYQFFESIIPSCNECSLIDLSKLVIERGANIGLATDMDGGRFGIIDSNGRYRDSNYIIPPLIEYLIRIREMKGGIVKSITSTNNIRRVANYYSRDIYVTPVGFKYLADKMLSEEIFIGVESSNGASLNIIVAAKDGILFSLLVAEMLAYYKLDMDRILTDFYQRFPKLYDREIAVRKTKLKQLNFKKLLKQKEYTFKNMDLQEVTFIDGIKFVFVDSWLLIRESGTSKVIRIYAEATSLKKANQLIKLGRSLIE